MGTRPPLPASLPRGALGPRLPPIVQSGKLKSTSQRPRPGADISPRWPGPSHPLGTWSQAPRGPPPFPPVPPRLRAAPAGRQDCPHPGLPRGGPPGRFPPPAPTARARARPALSSVPRRALGARMPSAHPDSRDAGTLGRSAGGSPGPRGPPAPLRPASAAPEGSARAPGSGRTGAARAPAAGAARSRPFLSPPAPRASRSRPGRSGGVRAAPPDRAGEPAARPAGRGPQPSKRLSERREETQRRSAWRASAPPALPAPRPWPPACDPRPGAATDLLLERRLPRSRRRWGSGSARGRPPPAAPSPARPAPRPAARPPAPPRAEPGVPRAVAPAPRAPSALPAPASAQATCPVPSDDSLGPGRRPALAPLLCEVPGAPAPVSPCRQREVPCAWRPSVLSAAPVPEGESSASNQGPGGWSPALPALPESHQPCTGPRLASKKPPPFQ